MKYIQVSLIFILLLNVNHLLAQEKQESISRGEKIYKAECISCHMANGEGIMGAFPPLAKSDYLLADTDRAIKVVLEGLSGEVVVNGQTYYGEMTPIMFTDIEVADIMNYILNSWGNEGGVIQEEDVKVNR